MNNIFNINNMKKTIFFSITILIFVVMAQNTYAAPRCGGNTWDNSDPACWTSSTSTVNCTWVYYGTVYKCADGSGVLCTEGYGHLSLAGLCSAGTCDAHGGRGGVYGYWKANTCGGGIKCSNNTAMNDYTKTVTNNTCHYIESYNSWTACNNGYKTGFNPVWKTVSGKDCSNASQTRCCESYGTWGDCDKDCGGGIQTRRHWKNNCTSEIESQACNILSCPIPGECIDYSPVATVDASINKGTSGLCSKGLVIGFGGAGTDVDPWNWDCSGQYDGTTETNCSAVLAKGQCYDTDSVTFSYSQENWPPGFVFCKPTIAQATPVAPAENLDNPLQISITNPQATTTKWTCGTANGTDGNMCSVMLELPDVTCGNAHNDIEINTPPGPALCSTNAKVVSPGPVLDITDGRWHWDCKHNPLDLFADPSCSAPSCLEGDLLQYSPHVHLKSDPNDQTTTVSVSCESLGTICCDIDATEIGNNKPPITHVCTGEPAKEIIVPNGGLYSAQCYIGDGTCENNGTCPSEVEKEINIVTMCTNRECTAGGTCQATPKTASNLNQCSSTCNSNADCSRGRMIETRP